MNYIVTGEDLTNLANTIRGKGGTSNSLVFPEGFASAVSSLSGYGYEDALVTRELSNMYFNDRVTSIKNRAFAYCTNLTSVNLPSCSSIGPHAFASCTSLTTVSLPVCSYIGTYAFYRCYNLVSLYMTSISSVPTLSLSAFISTPIGGYNSSASKHGLVYVPASLYSSFLTATNWSDIATRIVSYGESL